VFYQLIIVNMSIILDMSLAKN